MQVCVADCLYSLFIRFVDMVIGLVAGDSVVIFDLYPLYI
jgi:hypothetical protein